MKNRHLYIIGFITSACFVMNYVDMVVQPGYFIKSTVKILLFSLGILFYLCKNKEDKYLFRNIFRINDKKFYRYIILGVIFYIAIVSGFLLTENIIDFSNITLCLNENTGVTKDNFIFVSLYISFVNSMVEEIFFRGFGFIVLKRYTDKNFASVFSAVIFAFYHIGMTAGWVNFALYFIGFIGLRVGGIIFNILDNKHQSILPSWVVHLFINLGINTVGCMLFGII